VECSTHNGFIEIHITIPDFKVEAAFRIGANPSFVLYRCPLTTKIRKGHQVTSLALLTFGETELFHEVLLPS